MSDHEQHQAALNRFIELANELAADGAPKGVLASALMRAAAVYATYSVAGNKGALTPEGIDRTTTFFKESLALVQKARQQEADKSRSSTESGAAN